MSEVKNMLNSVTEVFEATNAVVSSMKDGDRKQVSVLTEEVAKMVNKDPKEVMSFVNFFVHNTAMAYVTRGKHGGLIKGTRPEKVIKPGKTESTPDESTSSI